MMPSGSMFRDEARHTRVYGTEAGHPREPSARRLAPGKLADILVVEGNPLFDINALGYVEHVVKGGVVHR